MVYVASAPSCPPIEPMGFGFHEYPHATAFGKLGLSELDAPERRAYLAGPLPALTGATLTDPQALAAHLDEVAARGVAWEHGEFQAGVDCLAVPLRAGDGMLLGSVAVSAPSRAYHGRARHIEDRVRTCAGRVARAYRTGPRAH